jgi:hypothetical protein
MRKRMMTLGLLALLATLAAPPAVVQANSSARARTRKPPADRGPAETRAERDKRLLRECRGKPNAGACEGYSH